MAVTCSKGGLMMFDSTRSPSLPRTLKLHMVMGLETLAPKLT